MSSDLFYITTPIFYPNGKPHIGHAYTVIATDALARFQRLDGKRVFFLTGTDEHGLKMQQTAQQEGLSAIELADRNSAIFREMVEALGTSNDQFIRTTEARHKRACQAIWEAMAKTGDIYLDRYSGWYSVRQEAYFDEKETVVGDDGIRREPLGSPVQWNEEETYFFRLSAYQDRLLRLYEERPDFVGPTERRNEVISFVKSGLKDLSISRTTFDWGVPVPGDPKHVMYVWVDALTNYITAAGYPDTESPQWAFWPATHVIGKDIVRFHAVYWPAFLMSAGIELPRRVFAHGFLFNRGEKMSKSVGNVVDPFALIDTYGLDPVRYFFLREVPFGQDGSYSHEAIVNRVNADLANDLGNLAQRSLSMIAKNCDGKVPARGEPTAEDRAILDQATAALATARMAMSEQAIHAALAAIFAVVAEANRYFAGQAPWALKKTDPARMEAVLFTTAETVRRVALLCQPFMPGAAGRLLDLLAVPEAERGFAFCDDAHALKPGTALAGAGAGLPALRRSGRGRLMLVDSHCHLDFPEFAAERDAIVARARAAGVVRMVTISTRVRRFPEILALAEAYDDVACSVGTHPHNAAEEPDVTADELVRLAAHPKVVAIGEAGLDYFYDRSPREAQAASFRRHIEAARRTGLPLVIHARDADADMASILEDEAGRGPFPFILHCFSSGAELARTGVALGGYVSFSGILTFKKSDALRDIARQVPKDRLLVETDAPFLAPQPFRGKRNEPAFVAETARVLAATIGISDDEIARLTTDNFFRLFAKLQRPDREAA